MGTYPALMESEIRAPTYSTLKPNSAVEMMTIILDAMPTSLDFENFGECNTRRLHFL
jgi:hypothetical protein